MKSRLLTAITILIILMMALPVLTSPAQADGDDPPVMLEDYGGYIQYVGEDFIVVDGMVFYDNGAFPDEPLEVDDWVVINAVMNEGGTFDTLGLVVDDSHDPPEEAEQGDETWVVGEITITDDGIFVGDYVIAPAGTFIPSSLEDGDMVFIMGILLNDDTIQATHIIELDDLDADGQQDDCDTGDDDDDDDDDDDCDTGDDDDDDDDDDDSGVCGNLNPVGEALATEYEDSVSEEEIGQWRCEGYGYGEIARALALANLDDVDDTAEEILARRQAGEGWGNILKDYDVNPGELAPGRAISNGKKKNKDNDFNTLDDDDDDKPGRGRGPKGNKGNKGRGNPHNDD